VDCFVLAVDYEVDAIGLRCPMPLLKAKMALHEMAAGQLLRVLATDAGSVRDFQAYANLSGHQLVATAERDGTYCYLLKK
jgi:tRNA 2-thiouridine synthesizing protein A